MPPDTSGSAKTRNARGTHGVGRPRRSEGGDKAVHDALILAANECLLTEATSSVPVRLIAAKAGVNQAMVNYYFSSKSGLFLALYERQLSRLIEELRSFLAALTKSDSLDRPGAFYVEQLIGIIEDNFAKSPSLFILMHSDMLDENSETRKAYKQRLGARGYTTIVRIMKLLKKRGLCAAEIGPHHAAYIICSTSAMPFILSPIFERGFDSKIQGDVADQRRKAIAELLCPP